MKNRRGWSRSGCLERLCCLLPCCSGWSLPQTHNSLLVQTSTAAVIKTPQGTTALPPALLPHLLSILYAGQHHVDRTFTARRGETGARHAPSPRALQLRQRLLLRNDDVVATCQLYPDLCRRWKSHRQITPLPSISCRRLQLSRSGQHHTTHTLYSKFHSVAGPCSSTRMPGDCPAPVSWRATGARTIIHSLSPQVRCKENPQPHHRFCGTL